jgi:hypothetical protein
MVDVDTFLTTLYVIVDDFCHIYSPKRRPGPEASLSESEVITLAIFARWGRFSSERDFYRYARRRLRDAFPALPDRSQFNRLMRSCVGLIEEVALHLAVTLDARGYASSYEALDTSALPVRDAKRRGDGWLTGYAYTSDGPTAWDGTKDFACLPPSTQRERSPVLASPLLPPRISHWPKPSSPCELDLTPGSRAQDRPPWAPTWSTKALRVRTIIEGGFIDTGHSSSARPNAPNAREGGPDGCGVG